MARQLRWWIVAELLVCAALAIAYLPPRATPVLGQRFPRLEPETPYRLRVKAVADGWREASVELRLRDYRDRLAPEITRRRDNDVRGPTLLIDGPTSWDATREILVSALDTAWAQLGLDVSKISVGVVIAPTPRQRPDEPSQPQSTTAYLLPDTSNRSMCLVYLANPYWVRRLSEPKPWRDPRLVATVRSLLGPCAFYARFGAPGRDVSRWLGARKFDLALSPGWTGSSVDSGSYYMLADPRTRWFWWQVYQYPPEAIACLAGRRVACRETVLANAGSQTPAPHFLTTGRWWRRQAPAGGDRYLSDVVSDIGNDRFREFWNSDQPVDTALAAALRKPVGDWTQAWQARLLPQINLGPNIQALSILLGLVLVAGGLAIALAAGSRREVG